MDCSVEHLETARRDLGLTISEVWWRYFALGGMRTEWEIDATLNSALTPTDEDRDLLAAALNERYHELGRGHPIPSVSDAPDQG